MVKGSVYEVKSMYYPENGSYMYGKRIILIRLNGCNFFTDNKYNPCAFCDHPSSLKSTSKYCKIRNEILHNDYDKIKNPIDLKTLLEIIQFFKTDDLYSIYFTGGEPLYQIEFLNEIAGELKKRGFTLSIQTNGTLIKNLEKVVHFFDVGIVDIKDYSAGVVDRSNYQELVEIEVESLKMFLENGAITSAKIIVTEDTTLKDIRWIASKLSNLNITIYWQPVYPYGHIRSGISLKKMNEIPVALVKGGISPDRIARSMSVRAKPRYPFLKVGAIGGSSN